MPTATYIALATLTLTGNDSQIVFASIPNTFRDLVITCSVRSNRSATNDPVYIRFNSDATNGAYSRVAIFGNGSTASSYTDSPTEIIVDAGASGATASSGVFSVFNFSVFDYAQTDKHKTVLTVSDLAGVETRRQVARWANTAAINTISINPYFGTAFVDGSTFSLYGIIS